MVPKDKVTTYVTYRLTKKLSVNAGGVLHRAAVFGQRGADLQSSGASPNSTPDCAITSTSEWSAGFALQNLTNKLFVTALVSTTSTSVLLPDRNWKLTLIRKW